MAEALTHSEIKAMFEGLLDALKRKDIDLFIKLGRLPPHRFWQEWKKVYPEDFPQGGQSLANASSIKFDVKQ